MVTVSVGILAISCECWFEYLCDIRKKVYLICYGTLSFPDLGHHGSCSDVL